ncbi:MAG: chlorophyll a/b-binding protein [Cyanobacteria bacterium J06636_16]
MEPNTPASQTNAPDTDKFAPGEANPVNDPEAFEPAVETSPSFGWNSYAERINGRFAMVGFVALLVLELFTHQDFFTWLGF